MKELEGQSVLCIGGASGMGRGIAEAATAAGAHVVVTARSEEKARKAADEIGCASAAVDISDEASVRALIGGLDRLDHLAITAGATGRSSFSDTPPGEASRFLDGKLWATHRCLWAAKDVLSKDGSITLISGGYATEVTDEAGHVHIAFQAFEAMARVAAKSFAPIRCNVLRPGFIDSALWDFMDEVERKALRAEERSKTAEGKIVTPLQFGEAAIRIMTSRAITGAVIPVDGGRHLFVS